jgi:ribonuclease HII
MALLATPGVAGADEAGRGPLAGPVVAAAVLLPKGFDLSGIDDSKKLTPAQRAGAAERIRQEAVWAVEVISAAEIDRINILHASLRGMADALRSIRAASAVVDGSHIPPGLAIPVEAAAKGDGRYAAVAAAGILAKTTRDALMEELDGHWPAYGFARHFGYPTPAHLRALRAHGPCPEHRRSFAPVRACLQTELWPCE